MQPALTNEQVNYPACHKAMRGYLCLSHLPAMRCKAAPVATHLGVGVVASPVRPNAGLPAQVPHLELQASGNDSPASACAAACMVASPPTAAATPPHLDVLIGHCLHVKSNRCADGK